MSIHPFPLDDRSSADEIVQLVPALRAFARTFCSNRADADDLVQETLTKAISNIGEFQPGTRMRSWLFTIMRNTFYMSYKKAVREAAGPMGFEVSTFPSQEWSQPSREVARAMDSLPLAHRQVILLVSMMGVSHLEAAEIFGCDIGTVERRLSRARRAVLRALGEEQCGGRRWVTRCSR